MRKNLQDKNLQSRREKTIASQESISNEVRFAYGAILRLVYNIGWHGACHATSAMLYILLRELGITSVKLQLGQCKVDAFFDHSWVTIDGNIYDIAIAFDLAGKDYAGPTFAGIDIDTQQRTTLLYGNSSLPFDSCTHLPATVSISEYLDGNPIMWERLKGLFERVGIPYNKNILHQKYKSERWEVMPVVWEL